MLGLTSTTKERIEKELDKLFEQLSYDFLGWAPGVGGAKRITFSTVTPQWTLAHLFVQSLGNKSPTTSEADALKGMLQIADNYLDSLKSITKSKILSDIDSYIIKQRNNNLSIDAKAVQYLIDGGMKEAKKKLEIIAMAESSKTKTVGKAMDIVKVATSRGDSNPTLMFITMRDSEVCKFCVQNHTIDGVTPKLYKLSEVETGYLTQDDRKAGKVSLSLQHPHCFTGSQKLHTNFGLITFEQLYKNKLEVGVVVDNIVRKKIAGIYKNEVGIDKHSAYGSRLLPASQVYDTGIQECLRITLASGHTIEVSEEHEMWEVLKDQGRKIEAKNLRIGARIPLLSGNEYFGSDSFVDLAELMGNLMGDGILNETATWHGFGNDIPYIQSLYEKAKSFMQYRKKEPKIYPPDNKYNVSRMVFHGTQLCRIFKNEFGLSKKPRRIPLRLFSATRETQQAFIRGLFAADGCVDGSKHQSVSIVLAQNDYEFLKEVQLLLSSLGYISNIYTHGEAHEKTITYANGDSFLTKRKACWRLIISGYVQCKKFLEEVGLGVPIKNERLKRAIDKINWSGTKNIYRTTTVVNIERIGKQQTYCLTQPDTNTVTVNGIVTGQCRCSLSMLQNGFGFDSSGHITYIAPGHDEYKKQRGEE
jgi:intein/homing endonuclease